MKEGKIVKISKKILVKTIEEKRESLKKQSKRELWRKYIRKD